MSGTWADAGLRVVWTDFLERDAIREGLQEDCVAYWKMDESSGTREDSTANNRDMTAVGTVSGVSGKVNNAAQFTIADDNGLRRTADTAFASFGARIISFSFWVKVNDITGNEDHTFLYRTGDTPGTTIDWYVYFNPVAGNSIALDVYDKDFTEYAFAMGGVEIAQGVWYFVTGYIDPVGEEISIQINGTKVIEPFFDTPVTPGTYNDNCLSIGAELNFDAPNAAGFQARGNLDEVGVWNRLLTADEIGYLYNGGSGRSLYP